MSLRANVFRLTSEHLTLIGTGKSARRPPLLDELARELFASKTGRGGSQIGLPFADDVSKLLTKIEQEARSHQSELTGTYKGTLNGIVRSWAVEDVLTIEWIAFLEHVTLDWIDEIEALLWPVREYRMPSACPSCGVTFYGEERQYALAAHCWDRWTGAMLHPHRWTMACAACGAEWAGDALGMIAHALSNADDTPKEDRMTTV